MSSILQLLLLHPLCAQPDSFPWLMTGLLIWGVNLSVNPTRSRELCRVNWVLLTEGWLLVRLFLDWFLSLTLRGVNRGCLFSFCPGPPQVGHHSWDTFSLPCLPTGISGSCFWWTQTQRLVLAFRAPLSLCALTVSCQVYTFWSYLLQEALSGHSGLSFPWLPSALVSPVSWVGPGAPRPAWLCLPHL